MLSSFLPKVVLFIALRSFAFTAPASSLLVTQSLAFMSLITASGDSPVRLVSSAKNEKVGKILMLHGWAQNACVFKSKSKGLTKKLNQAGYDCIFLEGPHVLPMTTTVDVEGRPVDIENGKRENARAWFLLNKADPSDASLSQSETPMTYVGIDSSLDLIRDELLRDNDYCAILGFSQGGVFAHILSTLAMQPYNDNNLFERIKCAVIASGFAAQHVPEESSQYQVANLTNTRVSLPSLHLIGEKDTSVCPELSRKLVDLFEESKVMEHEKGHTLPQKSAQCAELIAFLEQNRNT